MSLFVLRFLSLCSCIASVAGQVSLLTYVNGGIRDILGSFFGAPGTNASYDYVVVGGGTAGLTLATRLAEDPNISVAVIKAGGFYELDNGNRSVVPGYANYYTGSDPNNYQPLIDWGFSTVPQPVCA
jgi:choline dehydrogenase